MPTTEFTFSKFANNPFYRRQNAHLIDMADLGPGQHIVDLACGTGSVTRLIAEKLRGARNSVVIGMDHSAEMLKLAMEDLRDVRNSCIQYVQGRIEQASESINEAVDTVFLCNAIHYVRNKDALLVEISRTLKPGGKLAFNTSFFHGAHPPETVLFARKWMMKASRILRREYGLTPVKSDKVESRRQLTPEEYTGLLQDNGFKVTSQEIETIEVPLEGWVDISSFEDFITGVMPGIPLDKASAALKAGVIATFRELNVDYVPRNWLDVVAVRV